MRSFVSGTPTGLDVPGESRGLLHRLENWSAISIGSVSMGQEIGVTPIQLITAVSAIANGGLLMKPHVVQTIKRGERIVAAGGPLAVPAAKRAIPPENAAPLRRVVAGGLVGG